MTGQLANIQDSASAIIILITAVLALLADLFFKARCANIAYRVAGFGLLAAAGVSCLFVGQYPHMLFHGLLISDDVSHLMTAFICIAVFLSYCYSRHYLEERSIPQGDFYVLGLFSTLGMISLVFAHSLLSVYLGLELLSLPLYAMTAMQRFDGNASEAALKYFIMGAIASGMLLFGMSLIYGATGELELTRIANAITLDAIRESQLLSFALVFIVAGVGFKLAAVPFHMWAPDVYEGAPTAVTLFLSAAPKVAAVGMVLRLFTIGLPDLAPQWQQLILILALLSTGVGNLLAIVQTNIKRLFAYSAIAHMGYVLLGLLAANENGYAAALYYTLIYAVMSVGAFGLLVLMSRAGLDVEKIDDLSGLNRRNPWLAFLMMIILFSMAGVPPTVGFFAKLLVLKALVDVHMTWVAVLGLVFAVIGAFYYIRIVKVMYFDDANDAAPVRLSRMATALYSVNCLALLYWGIFPTTLISACIAAFAA